MKKSYLRLGGILLLAALVVLTACQPTPDAVAQGKQIYETIGCISCHGAAGEGGVGPALAGHTAEQVRRQVRTSGSNMPAYTEEQLGDEQLDALIAWIESLEPPAGGHGHSESEVSAEVEHTTGF